jgi:hypothetical protein
MRKLFLACAAAGFVAVGLLKIAVYAEQNPRSLIGRCINGVYFAGIGIGPALTMNTVSGPLSSGDMEEAIEIPADPEPIADVYDPIQKRADDTIKEYYGYNGAKPKVTAELSYPETNARVTAEVFYPEKNNRGRLPGKIVIDDGEALPINKPDGLAPEPNLDKFVTQIEAKWKSDDAGPGLEVTRAFWQTTGEYVRPMPYCTDDDSSPVMPPADEPEPTPRKKEPRRIWFPFMPRGTEVGGERELSPNGNDCREDPSAPLQVPGFLTPAMRDSKKLPVGPEKEASETPVSGQNQSNPAETRKKN